MESLERLQGLHDDLVALAEERLADIERLWQELEESLEDFRNLLDNPTVTPSDQASYEAGKVTVDEQEYSINDEFKHISRALGTALDLREVEAAKILISDSNANVSADLEFVAGVVGNYHERRDLTLQDIRLLLQQAEDTEIEEDTRNGFSDAIKCVLDTKDGVVANASNYTRKCIDAMKIIEARQVQINNELQNRLVDGQLARDEYTPILQFQKSSLFKQHEALGCILTHLFRGDYTSQEDFRKLEAAASQWNRADLYLLHYLPALGAACKRFGSADGMATLNLAQAQSLNSVFGTVKPDRNPTNIDSFLATLRLFWTAEYGSWVAPGKENEAENAALSKQVKTSLDEFALEFLLAASASLMMDMWRHSARQEIVALLLSDAPSFAFDAEQPSHYFKAIFMETVEGFVESWISNLPDTIRHLKNEEDDQRLMKLTAMQDGAGLDPMNERIGTLHLESFLILISFAFEGRPEASEQWWDDPESNLYGFLQWASKRQTVPRVGAFCEMLCSVAEGPDGASAAHKFLLEESFPVPNSRTRRMPSLNYAQIFAELELYSRKVHEKAPTSHLASRKVLPTDMNESESPVMLSTYLRLLAHLCRHTSVIRDFIYSDSTIDLPRTLLLLSAGPVPTYLRASAFATLDALLTDTDQSRAYAMWRIVDDWASNGLDMTTSAFAKPGVPPAPTLAALHNTLGVFSESIDQYDALICLLRKMLGSALGSAPTNSELPFPEDLGSTYRPAGVGPYIDFACGQIFVKRLSELPNEPQTLKCTFHCSDLIATGLDSFSENYVAMLDLATNKRDPSPAIVRASIYAQRHPFARLMQWILGSEMNSLLMKRLRAPVASIDAASPGSPTIRTLQRSIDIVSAALDLQPTYLDLVRPLIKDMVQERSVGVQTSIEDGIFANSGLILDLCQYAATEHLELALRSLALLQKLSASPKLNNHFLSSRGSRRNGERIVDMLGPNATSTLKVVSTTLAANLQLSPRELEAGYESPGYQMKDGILAFLHACLETQPELANVAHVLLGFSRLGDRLVLSESPDTGQSVFDAVIELVRNYPHGEQSGYLSPLVHIKSAAMQVLQQLWSSPISADITITQMRRYRMLESLFDSQEVVSEGSGWDERSFHDPDFWWSGGADGLTEMLSFRSKMYSYGCQELRAAASESLSTTLKQHLSTMLGKSVDISGTPLTHLNIFELGDFLDIDLNFELPLPESQYYSAFDTQRYLTEATDDKPGIYDIAVVQQAVEDRRDAVYDSIKPPTSFHVDVEMLNREAEGIVTLHVARNRLSLAQQAWHNALRSYVDMIIAVIEVCTFEANAKVQFVTQNLQLLLPKLDALIAAESSDTVELARAADALMFALSTTTSSTTGRTDAIITEKLFQLFRTCVDGILMTNSDPSLRSILYSVVSQYLTRITSSTNAADLTKLRSNSMDTVRSSSPRLINILTDDAEDGSDTCRLNALTLLGHLTSLARSQESTYILDALVKANILELLIEPLKHISTDFANAENAHRQSLLSTFEARMLLLLQISRTRSGATAILDAGLMSAIRASLLFSADPDIGFSFPTTSSATNTAVSIAASQAATKALHVYYTLLAPTLRLLLSIFTCRGTDNTQSLTATRNFLNEYRSNMVGLFKRNVGVNGAVDKGSKIILGDCVRSYVGLCVLCGFADWEDEVAMDGKGDVAMNGNGYGGGVGYANGYGVNGGGMGRMPGGFS